MKLQRRNLTGWRKRQVWCQGNKREIRGAGRRKWPLVPNSADKRRTKPSLAFLGPSVK